MFRWPNQIRTIFLFLVPLSILYLLALKAYYVGFFNDDAFHIIGARSLLTGQYVELNQPSHPPLVHYTPGYPLLLTPIAFLFKEAILPYQLFSILLTLGTLLLVWLYFKETCKSLVLLAVLLMSALNPLTLSLSGTVLSDVCLAFFTFFIFFLARHIWQKKEDKRWILLGAVSAFGFYIRPIGGLFPLALALCLAFEKRWRPATLILVSSALLITPYLIRNMMIRGQWLPLGTEFGAAYQDQSQVQILLTLIGGNITFYLNEFFIRLFYRPPFGAYPAFFQVFIMAGGLFLTVFGMVKSQKSTWRRFPILFFLLYMGVLLIWSRQSGRYLLPLLPLAYAYFFMGAYHLGKFLKWEKAVVTSLLVFALVFTLFPMKKILQASLFQNTPLNTPPMETFNWVRENTDPSDLFAVEYDGRFYLWTKRQALHLINTEDPHVFHKWVKDYKLDYILAASTQLQLPTRSKAQIYHPLPESKLMNYLSNKRLYKQVFQNAKEKAAIFKVKGAGPGH